MLYLLKFILHLFPQGTKKHPQTALEQQVESMGAHLSAYTSREHTAYYMKTLSKDLPKGGITCLQAMKKLIVLLFKNICIKKCTFYTR